jgi:putative hemolysin
VVALSIDLPAEECLRAAMESPFTRYPVYRGSLDEIIGVLHVRDLFREAHRAGGMDSVQLDSLVRPAHIVPETKDLAALLHEFRREKEHMAIVIDEYGTMEGIVTLEDLLEEIVGEIEDEFDLPDESVEQLADGRIRIDGTFPIDDFNEQFSVSLADEDYHTVAGFVFGQLGRAPEPGDEIEHDGVRFTVVQVEGSRIERLEVELPPPGQRRQADPQDERRAAEA